VLQRTWTLDDDGVAWRPNARTFEVDRDALQDGSQQAPGSSAKRARKAPNSRRRTAAGSGAGSSGKGGKAGGGSSKRGGSPSPAPSSEAPKGPRAPLPDPWATKQWPPTDSVPSLMVHSLLPLEAKAATAAAQMTDGRSIEETEAEAAAVAAAAVAAAAAAAAEAEEALAPLADWKGEADSLPPPVVAPAAAAAEGGSPTQGAEGAAAVSPPEPAAAAALNGIGHLLPQQQQQQQLILQQRVSQRQRQPARTSMSPPAGGAAAPLPPLPPPAPMVAMAPPRPPRRQGPPPGGIVGEALAALTEAFPEQPPLLLPPIEGGSDERTFMSAYAGFWSVRGTGQPHCLTAHFRVLPYRLWQEVHAWGGPALLSGQNVSCGEGNHQGALAGVQRRVVVAQYMHTVCHCSVPIHCLQLWSPGFHLGHIQMRCLHPSLLRHCVHHTDLTNNAMLPIQQSSQHTPCVPLFFLPIPPCLGHHSG
jgi:hypothetical protein